MNLGYICFAFLFLTSCNQLMDQVKTNEEAFTYQFNVNGCDTGRHSYSTREEMCAALQNDNLNNNCAPTERLAKYTTDCTP